MESVVLHVHSILFLLLLRICLQIWNFYFGSLLFGIPSQSLAVSSGGLGGGGHKKIKMNELF